jgi:hypothetical protein
LVGRQLARAEKPYSQFQASSTTSRLLGSWPLGCVQPIHFRPKWVEGMKKAC